MVVFSKANNKMYPQSFVCLTCKLRLLNVEIANMINPEIVKRIPAKSILLPVMSVEIPNSLNPNLMSGYAHPHAMAAVNAKNTTQNGCWKILVLFEFMHPWFNFGTKIGIFFCLVKLWIQINSQEGIGVGDNKNSVQPRRATRHLHIYQVICDYLTSSKSASWISSLPPLLACWPPALGPC